MNKKHWINFCCAAETGDVETGRCLLDEGKVTVNGLYDTKGDIKNVPELYLKGNSVGMISAKFDQLKFLQMLASYKANLNQRSISGATIAMFATHNGSCEVFYWLASLEGKVDWTVQTDGDKPKTAYDFAVSERLDNEDCANIAIDMESLKINYEAKAA